MRNNLIVFIGCLSIMICSFFMGTVCVPTKKVTIIEKDTIYVCKSLTDWELLELAIIKTESNFDPFAEGKTNDKGIFQVTPIWIEEVNRIAKLNNLNIEYSHEDAYDIQKSLEMFNIIQSYHNPNHSINKAISIHNSKDKEYRKRVLQNFEHFKRQNEVLKELWF